MTDPAPSKVKVVVRIRPFVEKEVHKRCVTVSTTEKSAIELRRSTHAPVLSYGFDGAYDSDSRQEDLFQNEIEPMLESVFKGIHTTIFAYGITGAGKTFTMQGTDEQPGLIPRVARKVLSMAAECTKSKKASSAQASKCSVEVSYLEIYNEKVFDLLRPKNKDLPIREDPDKNIIIPNLAQVSVKTYDDFANTYAEGCKNRTVAPTSLNAHSSRSHAVLILTVKHRTDSRKYMGKLHLIDLAGSEDNRRTDNTGIRMTESTNINKSLFVLGKVVNALNEGSTRVPYRDSKLTRMLQDSLGGRSYGVMIANISPSVKHYQDTFNTLNFASKSRQIINKPVVNTIDDEATRRALLEEYLELKKGMPNQGAKENRNPNSRVNKSGSASGQKLDMKDLDAYIQEKTKEAVEKRLKDMFGGEQVLKNKVNPDVFQMLQHMQRNIIETNKRIMEQCFDEDEEEDEPNNNADEKDRGTEINDDDAKVFMLTPFTKVATGVNMARRAKKYAKRGQYDRAIRYYRRLLEIMPEKETMIQKKITKLEQLIVTAAPPQVADNKPLHAKRIREKRRQRESCTTPMRGHESSSNLSSLMKSLTISDSAPKKKLSFDACDEAPKFTTKPSVKQTPKPLSRSGTREEIKRRQQTPATKSTSGLPIGASSRVTSVSTTTPSSEASVKRKEIMKAKPSRPVGERSDTRVREVLAKGRESESGNKANEQKTSIKASSTDDTDEARPTLTDKKLVKRVDDEESNGEESEEGSDNAQDEEEDEDERPQKNRASSRYASSSEDECEGESNNDSDYEEEEQLPAKSKSRSQGARVVASEEDEDKESGECGEDNPEREQEVLRVVNEGTMKQLLQLHGIGKKRAEAIIDNRPFRKLVDLKKIGLGEKLFEAFMKRNVWEAV